MANVSTWEFIVGFLYILGGLGIFLFGMRVMSEGIQKVAGEGMRRIMATMTFTITVKDKIPKTISVTITK